MVSDKKMSNLYGSSDGGKSYYRCGTEDKSFVHIPMSYSIQLEIPAENDLIVTASETLSTVKMLNGVRTVSKETKILGRYTSNDKCVHFKKTSE